MNIVENRAYTVVAKKSFLRSLFTVSGISIIVLIVGFIRQIIIARQFGTSQEMDIYYIAYATTTILVVTPGALFEHVAVPKLKQHMEEYGMEKFYDYAIGIFILSIITSVVLVALYALLSPLLATVMTSGFSEEQTKELSVFVYWFVPWLIVYPIFNALTSILKSMGKFLSSTFAEVVYMFSSLVVIYLFASSQVEIIPISQFIGYSLAIAFLLVVFVKSSRRLWLKSFKLADYRQVIKNALLLLTSHPIKTMGSVIERNFQSNLPVGGISAIGYASQLTNSISAVLNFKQIYVVPLSKIEGREEKFHRLLVGLFYLTIPIALVNYVLANDIIAFVYGGGSFNAESVSKTSVAYAVLSFSIISSAVNVPVLRMYQIVDIVHKTILINILAIISIAVQLYLFVSYFDLGLYGYALAITTNSFLMLCINMAILTSSSSTKIHYVKLLWDLLPLMALMVASNYAYTIVESTFEFLLIYQKLFAWFMFVLVSYLVLFKKIKIVLGK
ncbi:lipid II flippase MurJ [Vibrio scophthalmi]|uniref:lipid II flippase MurJ n=1 Tax=Vibrio scophthalmi TaxID=45658 RepID=UPI003873BB47